MNDLSPNISNNQLIQIAAGAHSSICNLQPNVTDSHYFSDNAIIVSTPLDVETILGLCNVINGDIVISNDYDGQFDLNVITFNGSLYQPDGGSAPKLTSISLPFAESVHAIDLQNVSNLEMIFLPHVVRMSSLQLTGPNSTTHVICESLVEADSISLETSNLGYAISYIRNYMRHLVDRLLIVLSVNFSQLVQVDSKLYVNANFIGDSALDFPSLVNASSIELIGNMSRCQSFRPLFCLV